MSRYASNWGGAVAASNELKQMVHALHNEGIEVILDVVYNHTNEGFDRFPYLTSFRGIDNLVYYMVDVNNYKQLSDYSGCGNTLNCNHPVVVQLILDSLCHLVTEYHVDGFCFDLASILCRGIDGAPLACPPVVRAVTQDPILERFIKGDTGMKGAFVTCLSESADLYQVNQRKPFHGINFVIAHDGFTLYDLVAYNSKHNGANGEGGQDGSNDNFSWNCGVEGETNEAAVNAI
ncbi:unnamed protein product [Sphagnum troendelagicum]|uniref:Glycosyl hydrolase family 13 catalytic domain-containing protein n=1 Tax=Sphagnum troendelagicum TaxID=128251 RepID=A0ABP0TJU4_9BRYO